MNTIEKLAVEKYLGQRELPERKRIPADNYIDWAKFGAREGERLMKEKAIEAHRHACPIRIYRMFCPHAEQREKRTSEECPMNCDYMTRFKEEIDSIR